KDDSRLIEDISYIGREAEIYYQNMFSSGSVNIHDSIFVGIEKIIIDEQNDFLSGNPSASKIYQAINELNPDSASEGDGFT
ncbi:unnamed protein product, partial [Dovyalis caffra]